MAAPAPPTASSSSPGFECLGACDIAPMASIDERYYGPLDAARRAGGDRAASLRRRGAAGQGARRAPGRRRPRARAATRACSAGRAADGAETRVLFRHIDEPGLADDRGATASSAATGRCERALQRARARRAAHRRSRSPGLRGRGGAGFSMGKKGSFLPRGEMEKYLCCNADESEPGAFKDRELMQKNPHQLIEGCAIAALAVGATLRLHLHPRRVLRRSPTSSTARSPRPTRPATWARTSSAPAARVELVVHRGAGAYICGEETALLDSLEGKRGNPRLKPPFPAIQGLYGGPTLINNVETLSNVPHIVNNGADWFKGFGTEQSPGTKVVSVSGCVQRPGNYEIELGIPSRELIYGLAGGPPEGRRGEGLVPGRLLGAGADRGRARPPLQLRGHGRGGLDARLGLDHRRRRHASRSPSWRCARRASTTTSRAASARRAARAPTGR